MSNRLLFAGSDPISLPTLRMLHRHGWVKAVLSAPPRARGRHGAGGTETVVARYAREKELPLFQYPKLNQDACAEVADVGCNGLICVAYGQYFPASFLALFPQHAGEKAGHHPSPVRAVGTMNLHPSLLPRFRGASPITATLLSGDTHGGVSIIRIAKEMDGGVLLAQEQIAITPHTTRETLTHWCAERGAILIERLLSGDEQEHAAAGGGVAQNEAQAVWCRKITRNHGNIEWSLPSSMIMRQITAFQGWPGSFTTFRGKRLIVHQATIIDTEHAAAREECGVVRAIGAEHGGICVQSGRGVVVLQRVQMEYKSVVDWRAFVNGYSVALGEHFGALATDRAV